MFRRIKKITEAMFVKESREFCTNALEVRTICENWDWLVQGDRSDASRRYVLFINWGDGSETVLNSLLRWLWLAGRSLLANWADIRNQEEGDSERLPLVIGRAESSIIVSVSKGFPPGGGDPQGAVKDLRQNRYAVSNLRSLRGWNLEEKHPPLPNQK